MSRNGSGIYSLPSNTAAISGDTISSTKWNSLTQDLEADNNAVRPIVAGGTGGATALAGLTALFSGASPGGADKIGFWDQSASAFGWLALGTGLTFNGTTLELDADLSTLAGLTVAADNFIAGNSGGTAWEVKTPAQARTSLGLVIGTNVQAYDAGLASIAGLTTAADRSIYTTASDTYAVYTLTAAGRAILDDADAAAQRTTLGLGTSATVNTGTSGATIPLLNAENTWSATQTFTASPVISSSAPFLQLTDTDAASSKWRLISFSNAIRLQRDGAGDNTWTTNLLTWDASNNLNVAAGTLSVGASLVWHAGNDGAGSGLDADTLDGVQGSAFALLGTANSFTGQQTILAAQPTFVFNESDAATDEKLWRIVSVAGQWRFTTLTDAGGTGATAFMIDRTGTTVDEFEVNATTIDLNGEVQADTITGRVVAGATTSGTLTSASANKTIQLTGDPTINNSVFSAGDIIVMYAGASARTITAGTITTMRLDGTSTTGSRTLAARGMAMLFFVSSSEVIVAGGAVT